MEFEPRLELALLVRLVLAGALAAVLGWERQSAHKSAGLRTHMLVGIASALFRYSASSRSGTTPVGIAVSGLIQSGSFRPSRLESASSAAV